MDKATWAKIIANKGKVDEPKQEVQATQSEKASSVRGEKPVKDFDNPELNVALAFVAGEGSRPEVGQFSNTFVPESTGGNADRPVQLQEPQSTEHPKESTTNSGLDSNRVKATGYNPSDDVLTQAARLFGLEARPSETRISFWKNNKRQFIIESGRIEWKVQARPKVAVSCDEEFLKHLEEFYEKEEQLELFTHEPKQQFIETESPIVAKAKASLAQLKAEEEPEETIPWEKPQNIQVSGGTIVTTIEDTSEYRSIPTLSELEEQRVAEPAIMVDPDQEKGAEKTSDGEPVRRLNMDGEPVRRLNMAWVPEPEFTQGLMTFSECREAYVYIIKDFLDNASITKRKGKNYKSFKPYAFRLANTDVPYIMLPGSNWADTWDWYLDEIFDILLGEEVIGGRSLRYDKHRRIRYPRASGAHDWGFKQALGVEGDNLIDWLRRAVKLDPTTRQACATIWNNGRDLKKRTRREELDIHRKEEYQRLPCPLAIQLTKAEDSKGLDIIAHMRAMDFDGAVASDVYRLSEIAHFAAIGGYPKGYSGSLTISIGSAIVESYGASDFLYLGNLLEWYAGDDTIWEIPYAYPTTRQSSEWLDPNQPAQKAYDYFQDELQKMSIIYHNWIKCQWRLGMERLKEVKYAYFADILNASAAFEWLLSECMGDEVKLSYPDCKTVQEHLDLPKTLGEYPAFYFLKQVRGFWQYFVAVECARHFLNCGDYEKLEQLFELTPQTKKFKTYIMVDACIILYAKYRKKAKEVSFLKQDIELYERVCEV